MTTRQPSSPLPATWEGIRDQFPTLTRMINGQALVYLDTAATALRPRTVVEAEADFSLFHNASVHRGLYALAEEATEAYEGCRLAVARWLEAPAPEGVIITRNATAALNLVARGLEPSLRPGDEILLTEMEHHSNLVPWLQVARRAGVSIRYLSVTPEGTLDLAELSDRLSPRTQVVALTHVSNVLGTVNPVAEVAAAAHRQGALVVLDAAQSAGHFPFSFSDLGADFVALSAHKSYGPLGLGFLVGHPAALEQLEPLESGGNMIDRVDWDHATWAELPFRFEAGTANATAAAAYPKALELMEALGLEQIRSHDQRLLTYAQEQLTRLGGLRLLGPVSPEARSGLISFVDGEIHPHDLATLLSERAIAVRAGHHCAQPLHRKLGLAASVRLSFGVYSTEAEVDALVEGLRFARRFLCR